MREVTPTTVQIKQVQLKDGEQCLVHDGQRVVGRSERGMVAAPTSHTVLVGTGSELDAELERLKLPPVETPNERRARLHAERSATTTIPTSASASASGGEGAMP